MESISINAVNKIVDLYGLIAALITLSCFGLLILYSINKAGSAHFFVDRIWRLSGGNNKFVNEEMSRQWGRVSDLEIYNFKTNLNIRSMEDFRSLMRWMDLNRVSEREFFKISRFFNMESMSFPYKNINLINWFLVISLVFFFSTIPFLFSYYKYNSKAAYLVVRKTELKFNYLKDKAVVNGITLNSFVCENRKNIKSIFPKEITQYDTSVICNLIKYDKNHEFLISTIREQKIFVLVIFLIWFCGLFYTVLSSLRYSFLQTFIERYVLSGAKIPFNLKKETKQWRKYSKTPKALNNMKEELRKLGACSRQS